MPAPRAVVAQHEARLVVAEPAPLALGIIVVVLIDVARGDGLGGARPARPIGPADRVVRDPRPTCRVMVVSLDVSRGSKSGSEVRSFFERF